jgi:hypothetical protein
LLKQNDKSATKIKQGANVDQTTYLIIEACISIVLAIVVLVQRRIILKLTIRVLELLKEKQDRETPKPPGSFPLDYDREHPRP